jgi:hypothetical protein
MFNKLLLAVIAAALLFIGYLMLTSYYPQLLGNESFYPNVEKGAMPDTAPPVEYYPPVEPPRVITPGGPSTPNARVPSPPAEIEPPEVKAQDPYDNPNSSSFLQDNLRHPERMFSPETAQNGGLFMNGVSANDTLQDTEYSAF